MEAASADGFVFPPYLILKGSVHIFDWYKHVEEEDKLARWAVSPKGWTDSKIGYDWLTMVYDPISRARCPGEPRLLILDGHVSHINYKFLSYCERNDIIVFCLPPHSTHLLQPLDVGLFSPLQTHYRKAVEDYFLTTSIGVNRDIFFPLYKQARRLAYTTHNVTKAFEKTGICPFNPRPVLSELGNSTAMSRAAENRGENSSSGFPLERTPYTKCELRQQTNQALTFIKTASEGDICNLKLILRFSHTAEYMATQAHIANAEAQKVRQAVKAIRPSQKDMRRLGKGNVAGAMGAQEILQGIKEWEEKQQQKAKKKKCTSPTTSPAMQQTPTRRAWAQRKVRFDQTPCRRLNFQTPVQPHLPSSPTSHDELGDTDDSFISIEEFGPEYHQNPTTAHVPPSPILNTAQNPNRRLPDRPLEMVLRSRR